MYCGLQGVERKYVGGDVQEVVVERWVSNLLKKTKNEQTFKKKKSEEKSKVHNGRTKDGAKHS